MRLKVFMLVMARQKYLCLELAHKIRGHGSQKTRKLSLLVRSNDVLDSMKLYCTFLVLEGRIGVYWIYYLI